MNHYKEFLRIMASQREMAIATSVDNLSNVRIVNFIFEDLDNTQEEKKVIYFGSFKDNKKVTEFKKNPYISFTTVPRGEGNFVRAIGAEVRRSDRSIYDLKEEFIEKIPEYREIFEIPGEGIQLFEIYPREVTLQLDTMESHSIQL